MVVDMVIFLLSILQTIAKRFNIVFVEPYLYKDNFKDYLFYLQFLADLSLGDVKKSYLKYVGAKNVYLDENYVKDLALEIANFIYTVLPKQQQQGLNENILRLSSTYSELLGIKKIDFIDVNVLLETFEEDLKTFLYLYMLTLYLLLKITEHNVKTPSKKLELYKKEIRDKIEKATFFW